MVVTVSSKEGSGSGDGDGESTCGPQTYRGEEDTSQTEIPWIMIKGTKKKLKGGKEPIRLEGNALCAKGEGDRQGHTHMVLYSAGKGSQENLKRN